MNYLSLLNHKINENTEEKLETKISRDFLINYFNNKIYENDISSMWEVLNNWLIEKPQINTDKFLKQLPTLQINSNVITLCIEFVYKSTPFYIDTLLFILYSFFIYYLIFN